MTLISLHQDLGAHLASDGIPLHYDNLLAEYEAGLNTVILLDRSHEGRIDLLGDHRLTFINRMSTNDVTRIPLDNGCPTIFINPTARVIDRVTVYTRADRVHLVTAPARGTAVERYLQRNIFFNDDVRLENQTPKTKQFALHGIPADEVMAHFTDVNLIKPYGLIDIEAEGLNFTAMRRKPISGQHWAIIAPDEEAPAIYRLLHKAGQAHGLRPAGSLTYNTLRIRAGIPALNELSAEYIPLELGLWDEVSFTKGCYTGQEIIARMESRQQLAKTLVSINMTAPCTAPATIYAEGRSIGTLTSSVQAPNDDLFGMAIVKTSHITQGIPITLGQDNIPATIGNLLGAQPPFLKQN